MQIEVAKWTTVEAANGDPNGRAVVAATCYGALPALSPGQRVQVEDNPADAFTIGMVEPGLGVVVLKYEGDVNLLDLAAPASGHFIQVDS